MARTQAAVQAAIESNIAANPNLTYTDANGNVWNITNNTSIRALWNLWTFIVSSAQVILEQLQDLYQTNIETIVSQSAAASALWLQARMFQFQYDANNPQVVQLINGVPQYPVVNTSLCIVTACSVYTDATNTVQIKFATGSPLAAGNSSQIAAAQSYINQIGGAGINYSVNSLAPDMILIAGSVYYNGMYSNVIQNNVVTGINNFLQNLSETDFDGSLQLSDLEIAIRNVTGVNDVELNVVYVRRNNSVTTDAPPTPASGGNPVTPSGFPMVNSPYATNNYGDPTIYNRVYHPYSLANAAGYIVGETTPGCTFADTLQLVAQ